MVLFNTAVLQSASLDDGVAVGDHGSLLSATPLVVRDPGLPLAVHRAGSKVDRRLCEFKFTVPTGSSAAWREAARLDGGEARLGRADSAVSIAS
jgi:hypothetical protein